MGVNFTPLKQFFVLGVFFVSATLVCQAQTAISRSSQLSKPAMERVPRCDPASIDTIFTFQSEPVGEQTISLYFLNKGRRPCRLQGAPLPSFSVDSHSMTVQSCSYCGPDRLKLAPGGTASIDLNWDSKGKSCQWADWVNVDFDWAGSGDFRKYVDFRLIPSGWPMHICSAVRSVGYRAVEDSPFEQEVTRPALRVSLLQKTVYSDETATLHVELTQPMRSAEKPAGCGSLYAMLRTAPAEIRLQPLNTEGAFLRDSYTPEQIVEDKERAWPSWKKDRRRECYIAAGVTVADGRLSAEELANVKRIEWRTAPETGKSPVFLTVPVHFVVRDVHTLSPHWGKPIQGIRAGLSVDQEKFLSDEPVPVHVWWENLSAAVLLAQTECRQPIPELEIQDSEHRVLKTVQVPQFCSGHGWGPFFIAKGVPMHSFVELSAQSHPTSPFVIPLPGPGVYYLVSVWSARVLDKSANKAASKLFFRAGDMGGPYATARSLPVRIKVVRSDGR